MKHIPFHLVPRFGICKYLSKNTNNKNKGALEFVETYNNIHNIPFFIIISNERRDIMKKLEEITQKIEELRVLMYPLMNESGALTDPQLVVLSQKLDGLLNEYDKLLNQSQ